MDTKSKILAHIFLPPRMEKLHSGGIGKRYLARCMFCKAIAFDDIWVHYKRCNSMPDRDREEFSKTHKEMVASAEKDWREFVERKFEPSTFRKRWENILCPYCGNFCKNIHHSFVCASTPACRRETNKKIAFWNGS